MARAIHLADGAYATIPDHGQELVLTANHHKKQLASDCVVLSWDAWESLKMFVAEPEKIGMEVE